MGREAPQPPLGAQEPPAENRLDSWKEIAAYLRHGVSTVQRWEREEGLPVHRHLHAKLGSVHAYRPEIDAWWRERASRLERLAEASGEPPATDGAGRPWVIGAALTALVIAVVGSAYVARTRLRPPGIAARRIMIAVLPFQNLTGDHEQDYFSEGLTEEMITDLAQLYSERLGVIARTSVMQYRGTSKGVDQIGRELGVDYLLEGSVRRWGNRVRVSAQLIEVRGQTHLWAQTYERDVADTVGIQRDVAGSIAVSLALEFAAGPRAARAPPASAAAYDDYLKGRYFWNKRSREGFRKAIEHFQRAIDADPGYAPAYAGLADAYALAASSDYEEMAPRDAMPSAKAAATKALQLDETLAEAHASLGWVHLAFDWDWPAAEREFRRAIDLNPGYATAHQWYAYFLAAQERPDEALMHIEQARQLDPLSVIINQDLGVILSIVGRYEDAFRQYEKTLEMDPGFAVTHWYVGLACEDEGRYDRAIAEFEQAQKLEDSTTYLAALGHAYAASGRREEARRMLDRLKVLSTRKYVSSFDLALIYGALGQKDEAFALLEKAYAGREEAVPYLKVERRFKPIRSDPRFSRLVRRLGLPP